MDKKIIEEEFGGFCNELSNEENTLLLDNEDLWMCDVCGDIINVGEGEGRFPALDMYDTNYGSDPKNEEKYYQICGKCAPQAVDIILGYYSDKNLKPQLGVDPEFLCIEWKKRGY